MNSPTTQHIKYAKWQNIVIIFILLFMFISALPNLYPDKAHIYLTANDTKTELTTPQQIKTLLEQHHILVDEISMSSSRTVIQLTDKSRQHIAEQLIKKHFADDYLITSALHNNAPRWLNALGGKPIKLGLDLSGGVLFVLDVDIKHALGERMKTIAQEINVYAVEQRVRLNTQWLADKDEIVIKFFSAEQIAKDRILAKINKTYPELTMKKHFTGHYLYRYSKDEQDKFRQETMKQTLKTMRGRIEELGITEAVTQKQGKNRIRIELPGVHEPEEAKRIIGATASLDFYQLAENTTALNTVQMADENGRRLSLNSQVVFSGSHIKNARAGQDQMGMPLVNLTLDSIGGKKMSSFSKKNIGKAMVTVFSEYYRNADNEMVKKSKVINVATIVQHLGSVFSITNMDSQQAAQELSLLLRAGSLTAPVTIVKQRTIEATLGANNIDNGIKALSIGIVLTLLFMVVWYRSLGVIANVALALNLLSLLGLMSLLPGAVLTLPGIAGLVLTVGMAVDTNVLIFERIKEELKRGRQVLSAIEQGYKGAFSTILDANTTTMITGIILYSIGYGPVKGFALILCLGILTSMFTGVFVSKALTNLVFRENKMQLLGVKL
ncbi:protein translocase subunit SecD [Colwelliaceae bacterium MEBiC 14330]